MLIDKSTWMDLEISFIRVYLLDREWRIHNLPGARLPFLVPPKGGSNDSIIRPDPDKYSFTLNSYAHTPNFQNVIAGIDCYWSICL